MLRLQLLRQAGHREGSRRRHHGLPARHGRAGAHRHGFPFSPFSLQMEKQWQIDEKNPEFPVLRRAWRRNIRDLWSQICAKLQSKAGFHALFASETPEAGQTGESGQTGEPGEPGEPGDFGGTGSAGHEASTVVNVEFSMNGNMEHAFLYDKQASSLHPVEEPTLSMGEFMASEGPMEQAKDALGYVAMMDGESVAKRKSRSKAELLPFPDDFRHYKYLPVFCHKGVAIRSSGRASSWTGWTSISARPTR